MLDRKELCDAGKRGKCPNIIDLTSFVRCTACSIALNEVGKTDEDRRDEDSMMAQLSRVHLEVQRQKLDDEATMVSKLGEVHLSPEQEADLVKPTRVGVISLMDPSKPTRYITGAPPRRSETCEDLRDFEAACVGSQRNRPSPALRLALGWSEADESIRFRFSKYGPWDRSRSPGRAERTGGRSTFVTPLEIRNKPSSPASEQGTPVDAVEKAKANEAAKDFYRR